MILSGSDLLVAVPQDGLVVFGYACMTLMAMLLVRLNLRGGSHES